MKNKFKKIINKKNIFIFILGGIVFSFISVSAVNLIYSKDVTYDNTSSGLSSTTVQGALDELYEKAKNAPSCDSDGVCTVSCSNGSTFISTNSGYKCFNLPGNEKIVTSGDGLYENKTEHKFYYKGAKVNNYITFNGEMWRIISIGINGNIKIIRNEQLSETQKWDSTSNRNSSTSTYCTYASNYGCNAWVATQNLLTSPSTFIQYYPNGNVSNTTNYSGTVTGNSTMATYLNGTYYNTLSTDAKNKIIRGVFSVSTPGNISDNESLETDIEQEKQYQWQGYIALMNVTELLKASTSDDCTNLNIAYNNGKTSSCSQNNWLWPTFNTANIEWTLSPYVSSYRRSVWSVFSDGFTTLMVHLDFAQFYFYRRM